MEPPALEEGDIDSLEAILINSCTTRGRPLNFYFLPRDRLEASKRSSPRGNFRSSRQRMNSTPTAPVAPTTATLNSASLALFYQVSVPCKQFDMPFHNPLDRYKSVC